MNNIIGTPLERFFANVPCSVSFNIGKEFVHITFNNVWNTQLYFYLSLTFTSPDTLITEYPYFQNGAGGLLDTYSSFKNIFLLRTIQFKCRSSKICCINWICNLLGNLNGYFCIGYISGEPCPLEPAPPMKVWQIRELYGSLLVQAPVYTVNVCV